MKKLLATILIVEFFLAPAWSGLIKTARADAPAQCSTFKTNEGYFFGDYEQHSYVNGFLVINFQIKTPYNDGRGWNNSFTLYDQSCKSQVDTENFQPFFNPRSGMEYFSIIFTSATHYKYWDDEAGAPVMCGTNPCEGDLPSALKDGSPYYSVAYSPFTGDDQWMFSDSFPTVQGLQPKVPVLIVPGLLGSELFDTSNNNHFLWPNLADMLADPDGFLKPIAMNSDGSSQNPAVQVGRMLSSINYSFGALHYSDQLVADLQNQGYTLNKDLFYWPYDWRLGVAQNVVGLTKQIAMITQFTGAPKVDIIAHSYGGLIVKDYLVGPDAKATDSQIDKVIFVGVPQLGSAEAARALIFGSDLGIPLIGIDQVREVAANMNSIYDLLPSQEYFKHSAGYYADLSTNASSSGILNYDQSTALLNQLGLNQKMIADSAALHSSDFDNFDFSTKPYQIYGLVSCGVYTIKTINKMYGDPSVLKKVFSGPQYRIYADSGDGVVSQASASHLIGIPANNMFFINGIDHAKMLSADPSKTLIENLLKNQSVTTTSVSHDNSNCSLQGRLLTMDSSVQFTVYDANHNAVDPNILVNKKVGDDSNIFIPDSQNYSVEIKPIDATKPANFSLADITPTKTTINNYNGVQGGTIKLNLSGTVLVQKEDQPGQLTDVPPSSTVDQNDLTGDPGTPIDDSTNTAGGSGGGSVPTPPASSFSGGSGSIYTPAPSSPENLTAPIQDQVVDQTPDKIADQSDNKIPPQTVDQTDNQTNQSPDQADDLSSAEQTADSTSTGGQPQDIKISILPASQSVIQPQSQLTTQISPNPQIIIINSDSSVYSIIALTISKILNLIFF